MAIGGAGLFRMLVNWELSNLEGGCIIVSSYIALMMLESVNDKQDHVASTATPLLFYA